MKERLNTLFLALVGLLFFATSCEKVLYDDLQPCDLWVEFNYDYNMQYMNRFEKEAQDVQLFVFDGNGKFLTVFNDKSAPYTADFKMKLSLIPGKYTLLAYSGLDGNYAAVKLTPGTSTPEDLKVLVNRTAENIVDKKLKPLLNGLIEKIDVTGLYGQTIKMPMKKLTNQIRLIFQDLSKGGASTIDVNNYDLEITASNGAYNGKGESVSDALLHYLPYFRENLKGETGGAVIEFNTLRLFANKNYRLIIREKATGEELFNVRLADLLLQTKFYENNTLSDQEYLDRQDRYVLVFAFDGRPLTKEGFLSVAVWINGWLVREQIVYK